MKAYRRIAVMALVAIGIACALPVAQAEVTRVEITTREDVLGGKAFGNVGAYEKLVGKVYFTVDPNNAHNKVIVDIDKAPKRNGKVEFSSDLYVLKPKDPSKGNGVAFFDISNRGGKGVLSGFNRAMGSGNPTTEAEFGDGFLMREGYTVVWVGWEFDVRKDANPLANGAYLPIATDNGKTITGWIDPFFVPNTASESYEFRTWNYFPDTTNVYPPLDPNNPNYRLTAREGWVSTPRLIPREDWQFGRMQNGQVVYDPKWLTVKGGFKPGLTYQIWYETKNPPVNGLGLAALRDLASAMKNRDDIVTKVQYVYTYGSSQVGRIQRHMIYEGFTIDEQGRRAFDGMFINTGGTSGGAFNQRFGVPREGGGFIATTFPIRYETTTDPVTGKKDGLGAKIPAGQEPKLMLVDTSSEYWDRGRVAGLRHTSIDGFEDLPDPPNVRHYLISGTRHLSGTWPPRNDQVQEGYVNPLDYRFAQKALLVALDNWVKGKGAPQSSHPKLSDGTLVKQTKIRFPDIPDIKWPHFVPGGFRADLPGGYSVLPFYVPQVDNDGNETGGIRLPHLAVPLGTYTGWAFRSERAGAPDTIVAMAGRYIPFAKTRAERERAKDPRPSVEERYASRADYQKRVEEAANRLVQEKFLLQEDVKTIVDDAGKHWDWTMSATTSQAGN